jgi:hypothetical protein
VLINNDIFLEREKKYTMGIFTKEMLINAGVTLAVVMVGLYVHDKFVAPKMAGKSAPATLSVNVES